MIQQGATRRIATVFGGSGFLGRYIVKRLAAQGYVVRVAVRDPEAALFLKPMGAVGQVVPLYADIASEGTVVRAVEDADVVVGLVGILHGAFDRIHVEGAGRIARLAAAAGASKLVHVSAIGADPGSDSQYAASKGRGEEAVRSAFPGATILRPSIVFGPEDNFFNRFGAIAQFSPFMPVISGTTRMQPVYVGDVADAALAATTRLDAPGRIYELGGPDVWTFREILAYILEVTDRKRPLLGVPHGLAALQASVLEKLPGRLLTNDQLKMLGRDNVVSPDMPGLADLGVVPTPIDLVVPLYLRRFKPGGGRAGAEPAEASMAASDLPA